MKEGQKQFYHWHFSLSAPPAKLWPYVSDTNRIFRILGATPVSETSLSRSTPKGSLELSHNMLKSYVTWQETPYIWEYPYRFGVTRNYKLGMLKELKFHTEFIPLDDETRVSIKIWVQPSNIFFSFL